MDPLLKIEVEKLFLTGNYAIIHKIVSNEIISVDQLINLFIECYGKSNFPSGEYPDNDILSLLKIFGDHFTQEHTYLFLNYYLGDIPGDLPIDYEEMNFRTDIFNFLFKRNIDLTRYESKILRLPEEFFFNYVESKDNKISTLDKYEEIDICHCKPSLKLVNWLNQYSPNINNSSVGMQWQYFINGTKLIKKYPNDLDKSHFMRPALTKKHIKLAWVYEIHYRCHVLDNIEILNWYPNYLGILHLDYHESISIIYWLKYDKCDNKVREYIEPVLDPESIKYFDFELEDETREKLSHTKEINNWYQSINKMTKIYHELINTAKQIDSNYY